jgi:hypothetical protein
MRFSRHSGILPLTESVEAFFERAYGMKDTTSVTSTPIHKTAKAARSLFLARSIRHTSCAASHATRSSTPALRKARYTSIDGFVLITHLVDDRRATPQPKPTIATIMAVAAAIALRFHLSRSDLSSARSALVVAPQVCQIALRGGFQLCEIGSELREIGFRGEIGPGIRGYHRACRVSGQRFVDTSLAQRVVDLDDHRAHGVHA